MNKAYFYRNSKNINEYNHLIRTYIEYFDFLNFKIIKKIEIPECEFEIFINDFHKEKKFIIDNLTFMKMDSNDKVYCIFIYCEKFNYGILIYSAGYNYARYIAKLNYIQKKNFLN